MSEKKKILRNALKCLRCGDIIESKSVHDFVTCSCGNFSVDGGHDYIHRVFGQGMLKKDYIDLTEYEEEDDNEAQ